MAIGPATRFSCRSIADLDHGMFGELVDTEIRRVFADIDDRGHDGNDRVVTITLTMSRDMKRAPNEPTVAIDPKVTAKLPAYRSNATAAKIATIDGEIVLLFRPDNKDNVDQPTLLPEDEVSK